MSENKVNSARAQVRPQLNVSMIDFKLLWLSIVVKWYWIVVSVILCVLLAGIYLWFTPTTMDVIGKMEIKDNSKKGGGGISAGMAMLNSLPMGLGSALGGSIGGSLAIDSEKEKLKSNSLVCNVVKDLGLYTEYRLCKWGRKTLLYQDQPINVTLDPAHVKWLDSELPLTSHQIKLEIDKDNSGYSVNITIKENRKKTKLPEQTFASLPATIKTEAGVVTLAENVSLTPKQRNDYAEGYTLRVNIKPPMESAEDFIKKLSVDPPSKKVANILGITLTDENVKRGIDFVNRLAEAYNQRANDDKNEEARKTDEFVNARLAKIDGELGSSDAAWENSKKNFQIADPEVEAEEVMTKKGLYENKMVEIGTELQLHDYLSEYVHNLDNLYELIPVGLTGGMGNLSGDASNKESSSNASLIAQHNTLVSQRKELLRSMSEKAPQIQRLTESIKELHPSLLTAMKRDRQNIIMKRNAVEREYSKYVGRINTAPKMERVLTEIGRQREIKQGVYLLMLQKREETAMELANVADKGKLIETTTLDKFSAQPQKKVILLFALIIGIAFPIVLLYILQMIKEKVDYPKELSLLSNLPLVGEVYLSDDNEGIRNLRTNLLLGLEDGQKVIMFVSDGDGDGKTYLANQLTESLTAIDKKVVYFNADLRSQNSQSVHPADILESADFTKQMSEAKANNDFVIVDTPALCKYSDAYQVAKFADITCYVVKVGSTSKKAVEKVVKESRLPNVKFIINGVDLTKKKYKYYYK